ncbi:hypothetical protein BB560_000803 [Smittium megazygosporum]|uniref:C2H2-type domain-containing protein n=1 Tax=Smittium megazygosporum TaxID=133381 RepID=A0A2T9ZJC5_9FUNG|nr:hypothetical protein BB560_000803 [Smittium megazygosporum]
MDTIKFPSLITNPPKNSILNHKLSKNMGSVLPGSMCSYPPKIYPISSFDNSISQRGKNNIYSPEESNSNKRGNKIIICSYEGCGMKFSRSEHYIRHTRFDFSSPK